MYVLLKLWQIPVVAERTLSATGELLHCPTPPFFSPTGILVFEFRDDLFYCFLHTVRSIVAMAHHHALNLVSKTKGSTSPVISCNAGGTRTRRNKISKGEGTCRGFPDNAVPAVTMHLVAGRGALSSAYIASRNRQ